ncbi:hypothetical protein IWW56_000957 [Coemansia sp. RSA 2131]|nr:hypothetical protein IWW56_000957 [Coemansia sp. RSA 2131]KAJ2664777.1 hypothetical protein IW148_001822 [Coemansia sp. RSA 1199]
MANDFGEYLDQLAGNQTMRVLHMTMNGIAGVAGIFFIVTGVASLFDMYKVFGGSTVPIFYIVIGSLVALISMVGIAGSIKRSQYVFGTYSGILALLVVVQIIGLLVVWLRPFDVEDKFSNVWEKMYENDPDSIRYIEKDLKCCGFTSPVDMPVPANCSVKKKFGFVRGCLKPLEHEWRHSRHMVLWIGTAMVGAQIVALGMGAELARRYKNARQGYQRVPGHMEGSPLIRNTA